MKMRDEKCIHTGDEKHHTYKEPSKEEARKEIDKIKEREEERSISNNIFYTESKNALRFYNVICPPPRLIATRGKHK